MRAMTYKDEHLYVSFQAKIEVDSRPGLMKLKNDLSGYEWAYLYEDVNLQDVNIYQLSSNPNSALPMVFGMMQKRSFDYTTCNSCQTLYII